MARSTVPDTDDPADIRLGEMIVYVAQRSNEDEKFGAIKLNKILYYADFIAHRRLGRSISGAEYQHLDEGPAPRRLRPVREALTRDGSITLFEQEYFGRIQQRIKAERPAKLDLFSLAELAIIDEVLAALGPLNGKEASERSHKEPGWLLTNDRQTILYRTAWLSPEPLTEEQVDTGIEIARRHGLIGETEPVT